MHLYDCNSVYESRKTENHHLDLLRLLLLFCIVCLKQRSVLAKHNAGTMQCAALLARLALATLRLTVQVCTLLLMPAYLH